MMSEIPPVFAPEDRDFCLSHEGVTTFYAYGYNRFGDPEEYKRYELVEQAMGESNMDVLSVDNSRMLLGEAIQTLYEQVFTYLEQNPYDPIILGGFSRGSLEALQVAAMLLKTEHADRLVGVLVNSGSPYVGLTFEDFKRHLHLYDTDYATKDPAEKESLEGYDLPDLPDIPIVWVVGQNEMVFIHQAAGAARYVYGRNMYLGVAPEVGHRIEHPDYAATVREVAPMMYVIPGGMRTLTEADAHIASVTLAELGDVRWLSAPNARPGTGVELAKLRLGAVALRNVKNPERVRVFSPLLAACFFKAIRMQEFGSVASPKIA